MLFGFLWKASPTVVHIFLAIFLERFPELLLHGSLSFCSSPVHRVLVPEQVSGINSGTITLYINRKIRKEHTVLTKLSCLLSVDWVFLPIILTGVACSLVGID